MTGNIDDSAATFDNVPALFTDTPARGSSTESNPNEGEMNAPLLALANRTKNLYDQVNGRLDQGVKTTDSPTFTAIEAGVVNTPEINTGTVHAEHIDATVGNDDGSVTSGTITATIKVNTPAIESADDLSLLAGADKNIILNSFTKLGASAPAAKEIMFTGTMAGAGSSVTIITDLQIGKIINCNAIVYSTFYSGIKESHLPNSPNTVEKFYCKLIQADIVDTCRVQIFTPTGATAIAGQEYRITLTYIE
jgi:hypothetical protein